MKKARFRASGSDTVPETMMGLGGWLFRDSAWYSGSAFNFCSSHGHPFCRQVPETCEEDEFRAKYKSEKHKRPLLYPSFSKQPSSCAAVLFDEVRGVATCAHHQTHQPARCLAPHLEPIPYPAITKQTKRTHPSNSHTPYDSIPAPRTTRPLATNPG